MARQTQQDTKAAPAPPNVSARRRRELEARKAIQPRLLDRLTAAVYLSVSEDMIDRLIRTGAVHVVRLPAERDTKTGLGVPGMARRILVDVRELDALIDRSREVAS